MADERAQDGRTDAGDTPSQDGTPRGRQDWRVQHLWQWQPVRDVMLIAGLWLIIWFGYAASVVTVPLLLAIALAYLVEPVVRWLERETRLNRRIASGLALIALILLVVVPLAVGTAVAIVQGGKLVEDLARDANRVVSSVEDPQNERLARRVPDGAWRTIRDLIVEARRQRTPTPRGTETPESGGTETEAQPNAPPGERTGEQPGDQSGDRPGERPGEPGASGTETNTDAATEAADAFEPVTRPANLDRILPRRGDIPDFDADAGTQDGEDRLDQELLNITISPEFAAMMQTGLAWIAENAEAISRRAMSTGADALTFIVGVLGGLAFLLFQLFLTAFFFYFVSSGWDGLVRLRDACIPVKHRERTVGLLDKMDRAIAGFVRGRLTIAFLQGILFTAGYWLIGVPGFYILGPLVAIASTVPYLAFVGVPFSIVLLWLEPNTGFRDAWWWTLGAPVVLYYSLQAVDDYVWTPLIQGKETGLGTAVILFATFAGGVLMGVYGLLLAIPIASCLKIMIDELVVPRFKSWAAGEERDFLPIKEE